MKANKKNLITDTLFILLENKNLNDITISEIVKLSNISRTTFYNNFNNTKKILNYKFNIIII